MDLGDLVFWLLIGFALFSRAIAWLLERLRGPQQGPTAPRPSADEAADDFIEDEWGQIIEPEVPAPVVKIPVAPQPRPRLGISEFHQPATAAAPVPSSAEKGRRLRRQLGLDQRQALQRSVLLMTVLGPCRANEIETGARPPRP